MYYRTSDEESVNHNSEERQMWDIAFNCAVTVLAAMALGILVLSIILIKTPDWEESRKLVDAEADAD